MNRNFSEIGTLPFLTPLVAAQEVMLHGRVPRVIGSNIFWACLEKEELRVIFSSWGKMLLDDVDGF